MACLCIVVIRSRQCHAEHPDRERAAPGVTTHNVDHRHRSRSPESPGSGGFRHFGSRFGRQLNHADLAQLEEQPSPKRPVGGSSPSIRAKCRSTLRGAPGGNGAHCHKARAAWHGQLNSDHPCGAVRDAANRRFGPTPPCAQDHPWGKPPATTEAGPYGNSETSKAGIRSAGQTRPARPRPHARRPQGGAAVRKTVASAAGFDPLARNGHPYRVPAAWRISPGDRVKGGFATARRHLAVATHAIRNRPATPAMGWGSSEQGRRRGDR